MRVEEATTSKAAENTTWVERPRVSEHMPLDHFFSASPSASFASELTVERIKRFTFGLEDVDKAFDSLQSQLGIQGFERGHNVSVGQGK